MAFIDEVRDRFGVAPICRVLTEHGVKIAPSGYAFKTRAPSARTRRDGDLKPLIEQVFFDRTTGRGLDGARTMRHLLAREGVTVARCTVERLMRELGLQGARRGTPVRTTRPDEQATRPRRTTCSDASPRPARTICGSWTSPNGSVGRGSTRPGGVRQGSLRFDRPSRSLGGELPTGDHCH